MTNGPSPRETVTIAPYSGDAVQMKAGERVRIIDVGGQQIADTWAFSAIDRTEHLSAGNTRIASRRVFPHVGGRFVSTHYTPMLRFDADTSPGRHDCFFAACDADIYRYYIGTDDHPSCNANFRRIAARRGLIAPEVPQPINFFQNTVFDHAGDLCSLPALSRPGDYVELTAEMDLVLIVTSCSFDIQPSREGTGELINGAGCTPIRLEIFA